MRVLQTCFGSGQDFLDAWSAWRLDPDKPALLHIVSWCAQAPSGLDIEGAALPFPDHQALAGSLSMQCQGLLPGVHRLSFEDGRVLLTLCVGRTLAHWRDPDLQFDHIWLDERLSEDPTRLLKTLAHSCRRGTLLRLHAGDTALLASLPVCGFRLLSQDASAGAQQAVFDPPWQPRQRRAQPAHTPPAPGRCTIVGAGLAGAACAASLARRGWQVTVLDRLGPAAGASGLPVGLMAPHVSSDDGPLSRLSRAGLRATLGEAWRLLEHGNDWAASGVLQRRLGNGGPALPADWPEQGHCWSQAAESHPGLSREWAPVAKGALWHGSGAWIKPARLVQAWLAHEGITLRTGEVARLTRTTEGIWQVLDQHDQCLSQSQWLILATAHQTQALLQSALGTPDLGLQALRGQVSWAPQLDGERLPPWPVNGHGSLLSFAQDQGRAWLLGASFERDDTGLDIRPSGHAANLSQLQALLPGSAAQLAPRFAAGQVQGWAGVRCAFRDHLPVVGPLSAQHPGLWLCTAFGSRGLSYSALCAELLAAWLHAEPLPLEPRLALALRAGRLLPVG